MPVENCGVDQETKSSSEARQCRTLVLLRGYYRHKNKGLYRLSAVLVGRFQRRMGGQFCLLCLDGLCGKVDTRPIVVRPE